MNRRKAVKTLAAGLTTPAFLPFLNNLYAESKGDVNLLPKRFIFIVKSSGLDLPNFTPVGYKLNGANSTKYAVLENRTELRKERIKKSTLPRVLKPLEKYTDRMSVIQGLSGKNFRGNHSVGLGLLSCFRSEKISVAPTLDYILGEKFSRGPFPMYGMAINSIVLSRNSSPEDGFIYPNISGMGGGRQIPFQATPKKAFLDLFGSAVLSPKAANRRLSVNTNLMDFLSNDAKRIENRLSTEEKMRFEGYKDAFEALRVKEDKKRHFAGRINKYAPEFTDKYNSTVETVRQECQFDMAASALITGLTNVVTLRPDTLGTIYSGLGHSNYLHSIGHGRPANDGIESMEGRKMIQEFHMKQIAKMADRLSSVPEGKGTMLDNTLIVYTSCAGGGHHDGWTDFPFVLVGGIAEKLKMGNYLFYPTYENKGHKTLANLYMSILHASGADYGETFGQLDPQLKDLDLNGPLGELI